MKEFNTLKLQHEESMERLQALYDMGLKDANFEPADEINEINIQNDWSLSLSLEQKLKIQTFLLYK